MDQTEHGSVSADTETEDKDGRNGESRRLKKQPDGLAKGGHGGEGGSLLVRKESVISESWLFGYRWFAQRTWGALESRGRVRGRAVLPCASVFIRWFLALGLSAR